MAISALLYDVQTLVDATVAWRQYLAVERGLAPKTVAAYMGDVGRFGRWIHAALDQDLDIRQAIDLKVLRAYVRHLGVTRGCQSATIARTVAALKSLSTWALREGAIPADVGKDLQRPKVVNTIPSFLAHDELSRLVEWTAHQPRPWPTHARDHALVVLFAYSGARLSEVADFRTDDLDLQSQTIRLHGKGRHDRVVPIAPQACQVLEAWLGRRPRSPWLFPGASEGRLHVRTIQRIVARTSKAALGRAIHPHTLRHSYATLLHRAGVSIRDLQLLLGHASIATTQVYLHAAPRDLDHIRKIDVAGLGDPQLSA